MTSRSSVARPYAEAVFALAREGEAYDRWSAFLERAAMVMSDATVARLIRDPRVARDALLDMIAELSQAEGETHNLLRLLLANGKLEALPEIAAQYEQLRAAAEGTVDAELVSAFAVGDAHRKDITAALSKQLGRRVRLSVAEDRRLIGGAVVRSGDQVWDGSVQAQLTQLAGALGARS